MAFPEDTRFNQLTHRRISIGMTITAAVTAAVLMWFITPYGPGVSTDSTVYIQVARNLLNGKGLSINGGALTHYPPGYPLILAAVGFFLNGNVLLAARILTVLLFAANFVIMAVTVQLCTKHDWSATACMTLFFASCPSILKTHTMAWTEAPFITCMMIGFLMCAYHMKTKKPLHLTMAAIALGTAIMFRYVGIVLVPLVVFIQLILLDKPLKKRILDSLTLSAIAGTPLLCWLVRNRLVAESATNRTIAFHPVNMDHLLELASTICEFFVGLDMHPVLEVSITFVLLFVLYGASIIFTRKRLDRRTAAAGKETMELATSLPVIFVTFFLFYLGFLVLSISFADAHTPVNDRILLPPLLPLAATVIILTWNISQDLHKRTIWLTFIVLNAALFGAHFEHARIRVWRMRHRGVGYAEASWRNSAILQFLSELGDDREIFTNAHEAIQFHLG